MVFLQRASGTRTVLLGGILILASLPTATGAPTLQRPSSATDISATSSQTTHYDHGDPSPHEQLMLELINRARAAPAAEAARLGIDLNEGLPPGEIQDTPKQPLALHPALIDAAREHSHWMLADDTFSHTGANGSDPGMRMQAAGYAFSGNWTWGENIGWGGSTGQVDFTAQTIARHEGLFRSPGHRTNILNNNFDEVGLGVVGGTFTTSRDYNAVMATQNFARSGATPGPLALGVVYRDSDIDGFYDPGEGVGGIEVTLSHGEWHTTTSASGGYALPLPSSSTVQLAFSGGDLREAQVFEISPSGRNIKLDLDLASIPGPVAFVSESIRLSPADGLRATVTGNAGTSFRLEYSSNLLSWVSVATYVIEQDGFVDVRHVPPPGPAFYRVSR